MRSTTMLIVVPDHLKGDEALLELVVGLVDSAEASATEESTDAVATRDHLGQLLVALLVRARRGCQCCPFGRYAHFPAAEGSLMPSATQPGRPRARG